MLADACERLRTLADARERGGWGCADAASTAPMVRFMLVSFTGTSSNYVGVPEVSVATARKTTSGSARATTDHDEIREWVERHGGEPAIVKRTRGSGRAGNSGILRIDFPGYSGEGSLEAISWEDFFERFEKANLAFLYQERTGRGGDSRFNKLVSRDSIDAGESGAAGESGSASESGSTRKTGSRGGSRSKTKGSSTRGQQAANDSGESGQASRRRQSVRAGSSSKPRRAQSSSKIAKETGTGGRMKTAARMGATSRTKKSAKKSSSRSRSR
jgi:hypothetical protein